MTRALLVLACALGGCATETPRATVALPTPLPSPPPVETSAPSLRLPKASPDAADFTSERGLVHLTREAGTAAGSFGASGVMACTLTGDRFDCQWYENTAEGRAVLQRRAGGRLVGTWGAGASGDDRGAWTLEPVASAASSFSGRSPFEGAWDTNFGAATVRASVGAPNGLTVDYRDGTMECEQPTAQHLRCVWIEGTTHGQAVFDVESPRVMRGTWGNDRSSTDGGSWLFVRR